MKKETGKIKEENDRGIVPLVSFFVI